LLPETLEAAVRAVGEANAGSLLIDAGRGRALLTDATRVLDVARGLKRSGFTRFVDFTGSHNVTRQEVGQGASPVKDSETAGSDIADIESRQGQRPVPPLPATVSFTFYLTLRAPAHAHARFTLKWKWTQSASDTPCDNAPRGAGQPGDELQAGPVPQGGIHPSLSTVWPAAAVAEREVFEMLGVPFAGNALDPLLLDESFVGFPLRSDYDFHTAESFAQQLLRERHEAALLQGLREDTA
jgi:NADH:ubiquinone oxidoreductase subunit C